MNNPTHPIAREVIGRYKARTATSMRLNDEAARWLPGGNTRTVSYYWPYPLYLANGEGCAVVDVDGNEYLDGLNNASSLIHGHRHPATMSAVREQLGRGTALGAPTAEQFHLAKLVCERIPSMDKIRFTQSGTEATMWAIKAARAFTERDVVIKIDGGYHGTHNDVSVNLLMDMTEKAVPQAKLPAGFPHVQVLRGVPSNVLENTVLVPFNDLEAAEEALSRYRSQVAAVIVEPMLGTAGFIPPEDGYLAGLRALTTRHGALLIFDECITFRLGPLQKTYGVTPDLTTCSKIIGGGFPIGAFGGRDDIMAQFDPTRPGFIPHSGSFIGNNMSMVAGLAAMTEYSLADVDRLNALGDDLRARLSEKAAALGVELELTGIGSVVGLHWGKGAIRNARDAATRKQHASELSRLFGLEMLNQGIFMYPGWFVLSTAMTDVELTRCVDAFASALTTLKPYMTSHVPEILTNERAAPAMR